MAGQSIGEMFINLGVKGSEKTIGALGETAKGFSGLTSMSLEAKAAMIGVFYGLEKFFAATGAQGVSLTNLSTITGMNTKTLQQYEFALRQVGGTAAEMDSTFKGLQNSITNMIFGKGAPERLLAVVSELKKAGVQIENQEQLKWAEHPELLFQRLQQYAQLSNVPIFEKTNFLKSFGLAETAIAGLEKNVFRPDVFAKAPIYSEKTIKGLNDSAIAWSDVAEKFEKAFAPITAEFGKPLAEGFAKLADPIAHLVKSIIELSEKMKLLEGIGKTFEGWAKLLDLSSGKLGKPATGGVIANYNPTGTAPLPWNIPDLFHDFMNAWKMQTRLDERAQRANTTLNVNQTFNGQADPPKVKDATVAGVKEVTYQSPSINKP